MFKLEHKAGKRTRAQAMVEFALALPVLLLVVYGLLETGRLLFIYASTVTAARQAIRYGSATGVNSSGTPYYQDCTGIRAAIHNVGFINRFDDADIEIEYDHGPNDTNPPFANCNGSTYSGDLPHNGDRITVVVSTDWIPIVPLVPLDAFTITAHSSRTILVSVDIAVTAPPGQFIGSDTGTLALEFLSPTSYSATGPLVLLFRVSNSAATGDLTGPFNIAIAGRGDPVTCSSAPATVTPGSSFECVVTITVTQDDLDVGSITTTASATSTASNTATADVILTGAQLPALTLTKSAFPTSGSAGSVITYTYTLTNSGNVSITSPYTVDDNKLGVFDCAGATSPLAPQASTSCAHDYTVTDQDVNNGSITNQAVVEAVSGTTTIQSNTASATVNTRPIGLTASGTPASVNQANQIITYSYVVLNNSASPFTFSIDNGGFTSSISCPTKTLASGDQTTCSGSHTVTQAELDAGNPLVNTVTATAPGGLSNTATTTVTVVPSAALSLSISASPNPATTLNATVTYTYTLTNSGYVTLSPTFAVTDNQVSGITCPDQTSMAPGATKTCTGTRTISQADLDAGSVIDQAAATATYNSQTVTSSAQSVTLVTFAGARLKLAITANPTSVMGTGAVITYTYTLTNTGSVPLTSPYTFAAGYRGSAPDCSLASNTLAVGASTTCTGSYTTVSADVTAGSVTNTTTASAKNGATTVTSASASATVTVSPVAACVIKHSVLKLPPSSTFGLTIFNNNNFSITISSVTIFFNDSPTSQKIQTLRIGGANVWTNNANVGSPLTISSGWSNTGSLTIPANNNAPLEVASWSDTYTVNGTERIIISFSTPSCPDLDSSNSSQLQ